MIKRIRSGVTAPKGFLASGIHAGIKKPPQLDLALIASLREGPIAGLFTTNQIPAAPVILDRLNIKQRVGRAIIINSGNANAFTGPQGLRDARETAQLVANKLGCLRHTVYIGSTGVIGPTLPMSDIRKGIPHLIQRLRKAGHREAAKAIMTTDTKVKEIALHTRIGGKVVSIGGMAKGSGMIHPNMATMLAYLTSDIVIHQKTLQSALKTAVDQSLNCISVDGETSTNDTVLCLTNGLAGNPILRTNSSGLAKFQDALSEACQSLALQIIRDGEGATKLVEIIVTGSKNISDAKRIANTIATSPLVKTALFGEDPNWGRIIAAIGRAGPSIQQGILELEFDKIPVVRRGKALGTSVEQRVKRLMRKNFFTVKVTTGRGPASTRVWTTDLSYEYVRINASYRS